MARNQPLGIELVKRGIVTGQDIEKALKYQETHRSRKIGDILYIFRIWQYANWTNRLYTFWCYEKK